MPNDEQAGLQQILNNLIIAMLIFSVPLALTMLARGGKNVELLYLSQAAGAVLLYLTRRGHIQFVRYAVTVVLFALITGLAAFGQGVRDNAIPAYFAMLSLSALVIGPNAPMVFAALIGVAYSGMAILENAKILTTGYATPPTWSAVVYFVSIVFLAATLFRATIRQLQKSVVRAEQSEKALAERNRQLEASQAEIQALNQSLEKRVQERTQSLEAARQRAMLIADTSTRMTRAQTEEEIVMALREIAQRIRADFAILSYYELDANHQPIAIQTIALQDDTGQFFPLDQLGQTYFPLTDYPLARLGMMSPDQPMFIEDFMNDPRINSAEREAGKVFFIGAMVLIPLRVRGVWQAQLSFTWRQPRTFEPEDRDLIAELMPRLADNVAARRAYLAEQAARRENERLYAEQRVIAEKLREADEMKTNFLASMSHELRTPLNAILNFTRFVSSGMFGPVNDRQLDALNKTLSSGKHLLNLINDVLDVTKIEANMLNLFIEGDVDLLAEIETAISSSQALLEDKDVTIIRDLPASLPPITGDRRRIRQILLNLLSNACKFTAEGTITVHADQRDDRILMYVRDTGPGIPLDDQQIIFEPFRQSRKGLTQGGGTGLGLAIARRLAEAHEGHLWLESKVGEGSTFYVELPVESAKLHQKMIETGGSKA